MPDSFHRVEGRYLEFFLKNIPYVLGYVELAERPLAQVQNRVWTPYRDRLRAFRLTPRFFRIMQEDPTFRGRIDEESGETVISGMGELHLDVYVERMKREYHAEVETGQPQVAYREAISRRAEFNYTHKKQTGGSGQYAKIDYVVEPGEVGSGFEFESQVTGGNVPREFWPAIEKGFKTSLVALCFVAI